MRRRDGGGTALHQGEPNVVARHQREERGIEPAQVAGPHEQVFVREQQCDRDDAEPISPAEVQAETDSGKQGDGQRVQNACAPKRAVDAEADGDGVQSLRDVEVTVTANPPADRTTTCEMSSTAGPL